MMKQKTILIVGLGLIGGCYAQGLTKQGYTVYAVDPDEEAIRFALGKGYIQKGASVPEPALIGAADAVVLGLYPTKMVEWIKENQQYFKSGIFVTDVSGVKRAVVYDVQAVMRPDVEFIAAHPMAGREVSGVKNSDNRIFLEANYIVTPTDQNTAEGIEFAEELGRTLRFDRITTLSPEEHDRMIGYLSQLTHAIAVSLMNANPNEHLVAYTGDSFRDLTRIAKINETMWTELFFLNKDMLVPEIDAFIAALTHLKEQVETENAEELSRLFVQSTERRKLFDKA